MWKDSWVSWWKERAKEDEQAMQGRVRDFPLAITSLENKTIRAIKVLFIFRKKLLCKSNNSLRVPVAHRDGRIEMRFHSNGKPFTYIAICFLGIILNSQPGASFGPKLTVHQHTVYKLPKRTLICPAVLCVWVNGALRTSFVLIYAVCCY